jgi:hypothetical protein
MNITHQVGTGKISEFFQTLQPKGEVQLVNLVLSLQPGVDFTWVGGWPGTNSCTSLNSSICKFSKTPSVSSARFLCTTRGHLLQRQ